jgi:alkaline phosphatase
VKIYLFVVVVSLLLCALFLYCSPDTRSGAPASKNTVVRRTIKGPNSPQEWYEAGENALESAEKINPEKGTARNVILFIGDGMGVSTVTAARILDGQMRGESGEENLLSFEKFPYVALSKTYSVDEQTPDSAPTMTSMVTGIKTNAGILSLNQNAVRDEYETAKGNELTTILELAEKNGKSTGVVSTARITHATPAACYSHVPERDWEDDSELPPDAAAVKFPDIARQLIEFPGNGIEVALGGGRQHFLPSSVADPEYTDKKGQRKDGRNLTEEWTARHPRSGYVWNESQFNEIDPAKVDHLLGLFEYSHMEYEHDRKNDKAGEPALSEMTAKAIDILSRNPKGYFLHVEGGRIDHGHHENNAYRALTDTIEFAKAIDVALRRVNLADTLIIVTADHGHVFTIGGFNVRGNDILGKVMVKDGKNILLAKDLNGKPYTALSYANGPGYKGSPNRPDLNNVNTADSNYVQETTVPLNDETHSAEDVPIYATGPGAYLIHGVQEQNYIFHVMLKAFGFSR